MSRCPLQRALVSLRRGTLDDAAVRAVTAARIGVWGTTASRRSARGHRTRLAATGSLRLIPLCHSNPIATVR